MRYFCFFDTETTGVSVDNDMIISLSYKITDENFKEISSRTIEMCPFNTLEEAQSPQYEKALEVNGYKPEQIMTFKPAKIGIQQFVELLKGLVEQNNNQYWTEDKKPLVTFVGYNSNAFDIPLLYSYAKRLGIDMPRFGYKHIDVYPLIFALDQMGKIPAKFYEDGKAMGNKLNESVERCNINADKTKFHGSAYDTEMTYALFMKLKQVITIDL